MREISIPLERIEEALIQCAVPGFYGKLRVELCLRPAAVFEIDLKAERKTITQPKDPTRDESPIIPSNRRVQTVRHQLGVIADRLVVQLPADEIIASFRDGHLQAIEISEKSNLQSSELPKVDHLAQR